MFYPVQYIQPQGDTSHTFIILININVNNSNTTCHKTVKQAKYILIQATIFYQPI